LAIVATRRGDIPKALALFDVAERSYLELGVWEPALVIDRGRAYLAAGLAVEAAKVAGVALNVKPIQPVQRAELLLFAALASLAAGQPEVALARATDASRMFASQRREVWVSKAQLLTCQARLKQGERSPSLMRKLLATAQSLERACDEWTPLAYLAAGQTARAVGRTDQATSSLAAAAAFRRSGAALSRATAWLATALEAEARSEQRRLLSACGKGLDALDEHLAAFGASEVRAMATSHGQDLARLALSTAIDRGSARSIFAWSERWRSTSLRAAWDRQPLDSHVETALAALRHLTDSARAPAHPTTELSRQREREIAALRLRVAGMQRVGATLNLGDLEASLGSTELVTLVRSRGVLHAVLVRGGRFRHRVVGPDAKVARLVEFARFALRRMAYGRTSSDAAETLEGSLQRLEDSLLGRLFKDRDGGPIVIVPPASLHAVPWSLLPALRDRPVGVSPSATSWLDAKSRSTSAQVARVAIVLGPGLVGAGSEVAALARLHHVAGSLASLGWRGARRGPA
jgi:tetratricopeptide (TPR) repeat protein